jgi:hypothetical protein
MVQKLKEQDSFHQTCCICLELIEPNNIGLAQCGHVYCYAPCLMKLALTMKKCAHCKQRLDSDSIYFLRQQQQQHDDSDELRMRYGTKLGWLLRRIRNEKSILVLPPELAETLRQGICRVMKQENLETPLVWPKTRQQQSRVVNQFNNDNNNNYNHVFLDHRERLYRLRDLQATHLVFLSPTQHPFARWIDAGILKNLGPTVKVVTYLQLKGTVEEKIV